MTSVFSIADDILVVGYNDDDGTKHQRTYQKVLQMSEKRTSD